MKKYDLAVLIGRFQPFHNGHLEVVKNALLKAERLLIIVGSSNIARTTRNPFTYHERATLIREVLASEEITTRVMIRPARDFPYDQQAWLEEIQRIVQEAGDDMPPDYIALTGHERDLSSFYLRKFPQWDFIPASVENLDINATSIRKPFFAAMDIENTSPVPLAVFRFLIGFRFTDTFNELQRENQSEIEARAKYGPGPFQTADSVVIQSGHLLVVERADYPGKGMLALPGGHLNIDETLDHCAVRELFEETCLFEDIEDMEARKQKVWAGYRGRERFDDPNRSPRGRVITEAFLFKLPDVRPLPDVRGADDAAHAFWLPLSHVKPDRMFDDHGFIVSKMIRYL